MGAFQGIVFFENLIVKGQKLHKLGLGLFVHQKILGQATKGKRWMPWRKEAMKDVASCEKPR